ncbi:metal ABC transporter permease [Lachnoclostridium sp. Marseille-P6806]|uniref:metal ABC transporter permease n=1 Tax=Lachnoclostridium sp. Marseille-P6806 TaxID=2364793 RepID=UPI001030E116|nr:metal ABC transporter permease [Lachnoclostridium sp. Marseille-P6806]
MLNLLLSYDFWVVALGTTILAVTASLIGCFSVFRGQGLVGDAIGHASYAGIVALFMLFHTRSPLILMAGAVLAGAAAYAVIQLIARFTPVEPDAALAIVLTGFFGLGMVLKSYIQGHPAYAMATQAGLRSYLFGSAAFLMKEDVLTITAASALAGILLRLFFKEVSASIFDRGFAASIGIRTAAVDAVLLILMITFIALGLKSVGAVLISSLLIIPCICAGQHSRKLKSVLRIAGFVSGLSSFAGTLISTAVSGISTGPMIILCMGTVTVLSMLLGRCGLLRRYLNKKEIVQKITPMR